MRASKGLKSLSLQPMEYNYIAIEGTVGAGKTTLATRIADDYNGTNRKNLYESVIFIFVLNVGICLSLRCYNLNQTRFIASLLHIKINHLINGFLADWAETWSGIGLHTAIVIATVAAF